jgi:dolichol-phosphate mannosyltransferase
MADIFQKFALVVPTLNEAENIILVLNRVVAALSRVPVAWEIFVVDDKSNDGTGEVVRRYARSNSRVRLLERSARQGLAGAITYGWSHTDADLIGVIDADLQHPPELLPKLIDEVCNGFDIAIASRYLEPRSMEGWNPARQALSRLSVLASVPVQKATLRVKDPLSGFFVLRHECIAGLHFQGAGFKLLLEILAKGHINSAKEIPFKFAMRHRGASKADAMTGVYYLSLLCKLSRQAVFRR